MSQGSGVIVIIDSVNNMAYDIKNQFEFLRGFNRSLWIVNSMELFERGAYYGTMAVLAYHLEDRLDFSGVQIGIITALLFACAYFFPVVAAALAEKYGYKPALVVAFVLLMLGYLLMSVVEPFILVFLSILVLGIGAGTFKPVISATIAHVSTVEQRSHAYAIFYWMINLGAFMIPLIFAAIGWIDLVDLEKEAWIVFVASTCLISVNVVILYLHFDNPVKPNPEKNIKESIATLASVLKDKPFAYLLAIYTGFWFMFGMNHTFLPLYMKHFLDMPSFFSVFLLAVINPLTIVIVGPILAPRVKKYDSLKMMIMGMSIFMVGSLTLGLTTTPLLFIIGIVIFSIGEYVTHPNFLAYISKIAPTEEKVSLYIGYGFIPSGLGYMLAALFGGKMYDIFMKDAHSPAIFFSIVACVGFATIISFVIYDFWFTRHKQVKDEREITPVSWRVVVPIVVGILLMPSVVGTGYAIGKQTWYEDEDEKKGIYAFRVNYMERTDRTIMNQHIDDGETYTFEFEGLVQNLTLVTIEIRYAESEEFLGGGGLCDEVDATVDVPDEYEEDTSTTTGAQTDCNADPDIILTVYFDSNFTWEGKELKARNADILWEELLVERAMGIWAVDVTVQVNSGDFGVVDTGEDVEVSFIRQSYEVSSIKRA